MSWKIVIFLEYIYNEVKRAHVQSSSAMYCTAFLSFSLVNDQGTNILNEQPFTEIS